MARNGELLEVLAGARRLGLPNWYLTAGCLYQTVWNVVTGRSPGTGIRDYDLFYFDDSDLSWEAEDKAIRAGKRVFGGRPVEIRNEARVHLWYQDHFGVPCPPHDSCEAAIDSFVAIVCCLGVRLERDDSWRVYAPHGFADLFGLVVRPNPVLAPRSVYEAKTARWLEHWPELTVLPWPEERRKSLCRNPATPLWPQVR